MSLRFRDGFGVMVISSHLPSGTQQKHAKLRNQAYHDIKRNVLRRLGKEEGVRDATKAHDIVFWMGDLNYRVRGSRAAVHRALQLQIPEVLLANEQLLHEQRARRAFVNFQEAPLTFAPSYKFDKGSDTYDTSRKQRVPSWTDRILFRIRGPGETVEAQEDTMVGPRVHDDDTEEHDEHHDAPHRTTSPTSIQTTTPSTSTSTSTSTSVSERVRVLRYMSVPEVQASDHKPVILTVDVQRPETVGDRRKGGRRGCGWGWGWGSWGWGSGGLGCCLRSVEFDHRTNMTSGSTTTTTTTTTTRDGQPTSRVRERRRFRPRSRQVMPLLVPDGVNDKVNDDDVDVEEDEETSGAAEAQVVAGKSGGAGFGEGDGRMGVGVVH